MTKDTRKAPQSRPTELRIEDLEKTSGGVQAVSGVFSSSSSSHGYGGASAETRTGGGKKRPEDAS